MGNTHPWRSFDYPDFLQAEKVLKSNISNISKEQLNLVMIGGLADGKSSFLNSVCSIFKGEIVNMTTTVGDNQLCVGTTHFLQIVRRNDNSIDNVHFYDTEGFSPDISNDSLGVQFEELKAVFDGRVPVNYRFNADEILQEASEEHRPHCVIFSISAEQLDSGSINRNRLLSATCDQLNKIVPFDVAKIVVITKIDRVCKDTASDIKHIYRSKVVYNLVKKVTKLFWVEENAVFPVANFTKEAYEKCTYFVCY